MIETPDGFKIPKATVLEGADAIHAFLNTAALVAGSTRIFKYPDFQGMEPANKAETLEDTVYGILDVDPGNYRWNFMIRENMCVHKALYAHKRYNGRVIIIDHLGQYWFTELSNGDYAGLRIQILYPKMMMPNDGSVASKSPFLLGLKNNIDFDKNGQLVDMEGLDGEMYRIIDVAITVNSATSSKITVSVDVDCDGTGVEGLVLADFVKKAANGTIQTITSINSLGDGVYELNGVGFTDGTIELVSAATLSIKPYELLGDPVEVDVAT
jgi:hypothetical protein